MELMKSKLGSAWILAEFEAPMGHPAGKAIGGKV